MKKYRVYWVDGRTEIIEGINFEDAFYRAGYSSNHKALVDLIEQGEYQLHDWNEDRKRWEWA